MKLNIGAGGSNLPGFTPVDIKAGKKAFPLDVQPGSVEEIYASHILEHFSYRDVPAVLADWFKALQPGGRLRVAVPDFAKLAAATLNGNAAAYPIEGAIMGGHVDADDVHRSLYVEDKLRSLLNAAGFQFVEPWESEIQDCASLELSLNLQGFKPLPVSPLQIPHTSESPIASDPAVGAVVPAPLGRVVAVWSCPRLGFMDAFDSIFRSLSAAGIKILRGMGVFWGQQMEILMDSAIAEDHADLILCLDYDAVFTADDLSELLRIMATHPEVDAVCAHQWNRAADRPLWNAGRTVSAPELAASGDLLKIVTGHFGLTLIRASALSKIPKPWFHATPAPDGTWNAGKVDSDIRFWHELARVGCHAYLAPRVVIGHLELAVRWPGSDLHIRWQHMYDYHATGKPVDAFGTCRTQTRS